MFFKLALESLLDRKGSFFLSFIAMTVSIFVLLSVEHIRNQTKESFSSALSGVDLIVGAKTGDINLLLYTVFRIGRPTSNVSWQSFEVFKNNPNVNWAIPISLGDSHKGFPVLGTNKDYFKYYSYGEKRKLVFKKGKKFLRLFDVVLGSEVAQRLNYQIGDKLVIAHGLSEVSFMVHDGMPFKIVGILESTGTPVDRTLHVKLEAMEAIHGGSKIKLENLEEPQHEKFIQAEHLYPKNITSFMVGLKSKITTFQLQRDINNYAKEPLLAVLPGVALSELWRIMSVVESSLFLISVLIFISASLGVSAILLSSIRERTKEIMKFLIAQGGSRADAQAPRRVKPNSGNF